MDIEEKHKQKRLRKTFARRLNNNIKKYSRCLLNMGGNVTMATLNYDFAYELVEIFNETITEFLLEGEAVCFDQFGKYEIKIQESKRMQNPFTDNKEIFLPELKMIRFYPALRLKERIRGNAFGRAKRSFCFKVDDENNSEIIEGENTEDAN